MRPLGATRLAPVAPLAAANKKRGFCSPLTACGGGHIHVPGCKFRTLAAGARDSDDAESRRSLVGLSALALLAACVSERASGPGGASGPGPRGEPMSTSTDTAVGLPPAGPQIVYPFTMRIGVADLFHGTRVEDPYRWLENLGSPAVAAVGRGAERGVAAAPRGHCAAGWLKARLTRLWNYERYERRCSAAGTTSTCTTTAPRTRARCCVSDSSIPPAACSTTPTRARRCHGRAVRVHAGASRATWWPTPSPTAAPTGRSGVSVASRTASISPDTLRDTKFWGVSWAHDGSGVYYSRYPSLASGQGDDTARPALYFHELGTAQHDDRLVYEVTDHPTRIPSGRVTEDGSYLVITLVDGYEKNGVELLDLRQPGREARSRCSPPGTRSTRSSARMAMSSTSAPPRMRPTAA